MNILCILFGHKWYQSFPNGYNIANCLRCDCNRDIIEEVFGRKKSKIKGEKGK